jgi:multidrug transporter EmrE-like cation transporter
VLEGGLDARRRRIAVVALVASIALGTAGQLLLKSAALRSLAGPLDPDTAVRTLLALVVYSLGIANWIVALRDVKLSVAYPVSSLNYVGILAGSAWLFGEHIGAMRLSGVLLIVGGVMLVVLGRREEA